MKEKYGWRINVRVSKEELGKIDYEAGVRRCYMGSSMGSLELCPVRFADLMCQRRTLFKPFFNIEPYRVDMSHCQ